jgi:hypothetical protein
MGNALGSTAAGAIYTNTLKERLMSHFPQATQQDVESLFNTLSEVEYPADSAARRAINYAYSDVMRYITFAALGASIGGVVLVWGLPDLRLSDRHNLARTLEEGGQRPAKRHMDEFKVGRWWSTGRFW